MKPLLLSLALLLGLYAPAATSGLFSIVTNAGEDCNTGVNISWGADTTAGPSWVALTRAGDAQWRDTVHIAAHSALATVYYGNYSKLPNGHDWFETALFSKCGAEVTGLKPATAYKYRIESANGGVSDTHYFKTAPLSQAWTACVISDVHTYSPLPHRLQSAMEMVSTVDRRQPIDWALHIGDMVAWGGSYSFWQQLYAQPWFSRVMFTGLNGNHDNMSRNYELTGRYFRWANNMPLNGYGSQKGVAYWFRYGDVLFIMLNNEEMRSEAGLHQAQNWVRKVVSDNASWARMRVVCEHYEWFDCINGRDSQYSRWRQVFDDCGIDLAISANNHIYARTVPLKADKADTAGTVYVQTSSCDDERGREVKPGYQLTENTDKIVTHWTEGPHTVGAILMHYDNHGLHLKLLDRYGKVHDNFTVTRKR